MRRKRKRKPRARDAIDGTSLCQETLARLDALIGIEQHGVVPMATRKKRSSKKRELIAPRGDKRYVRRTAKGRFDESDDQGSSLSQDRRKRAKRSAAAGQGD